VEEKTDLEENPKRLKEDPKFKKMETLESEIEN